MTGLSDRWRAPVGLMCILGLGALMTYWIWLHQTGELGMLTGELDRSEGAPVVLSLVRVQQESLPGRFVVEKGAEPLQVIDRGRRLAVGEEVNLGGTWSVAEDAVEVTWVESAAAGRRAKRMLGVVGLLAGLALWGLAVRGRPGQWVLRG